jgi:hypothetical protein
MLRFTFADGRPNIAAPPRRAAVRAGPTSSFQQLRELAERHKREDADIRAVLRCARAARRPAWRPPAATAQRSAMMGAAAVAEATATAHHRRSDQARRWRGGSNDCRPQGDHCRDLPLS